MNKLILIRGLPGSGKSTIAEMLSLDGNTQRFEADMYFGEEYKFDISKLKDAHDWCLAQTKNALEIGYNVVVSNTFTTQNELDPYLELGKSMGITPNVLIAQNDYGNIHNVPEETLKRMKNRFEYKIAI